MNLDQALVLAADPTTSEPVLRELWSINDYSDPLKKFRVQQLVAMNPNIDTAWVFERYTQAGSGLLQPALAYNPALPLWLLSGDEQIRAVLLELLVEEIVNHADNQYFWEDVGWSYRDKGSNPRNYRKGLLPPLWKAYEATASSPTVEGFWSLMADRWNDYVGENADGFIDGMTEAFLSLVESFDWHTKMEFLSLTAAFLFAQAKPRTHATPSSLPLRDEPKVYIPTFYRACRDLPLPPLPLPGDL